MENKIFGHDWKDIQAMQQKTYSPNTIKRIAGKDYGCNPLGNGQFKMLPSGDIVNYDEMKKRLGK